jgi:hypothetical protein
MSWYKTPVYELPGDNAFAWSCWLTTRALQQGVGMMMNNKKIMPKFTSKYQLPIGAKPGMFTYIYTFTVNNQ